MSINLNPIIFVIGAMKAGTSSFYQDIVSHPKIYGPPLKEPYFLVRNWSIESIRHKFKNHFQGAKLDQILLDGSTGYAMMPDYFGAPQKAKDLDIDVKAIVYLIREPYGRIASHFRHSVGSGDMVDDFSLALKNDKRLINYSRYYYQIGPWIETFGESKIHIYTMDFWKCHRQEVAAGIFTAMGLEARLDGLNVEGVYNPSTRQRIPTPISRILKAFFPGDMHVRLRGIIPQRMRKCIVSLLEQPQQPINVEFDNEQFEFVWDQLKSDLESIAPLIRHHIACAKTVWNRESLFSKYILKQTKEDSA